jgi:hypothetical protein
VHNAVAQLEALKEAMRSLAADKDSAVAEATAPLRQRLAQAAAAASDAEAVRLLTMSCAVTASLGSI